MLVAVGNPEIHAVLVGLPLCAQCAWKISPYLKSRQVLVTGSYWKREAKSQIIPPSVLNFNVYHGGR